MGWQSFAAVVRPRSRRERRLVGPDGGCWFGLRWWYVVLAVLPPLPQHLSPETGERGARFCCCYSGRSPEAGSQNYFCG